MSHSVISDVAWVVCIKMFFLPHYFGGQRQFVEIKNLQEHIHFNNFLLQKSLSGSGRANKQKKIERLHVFAKTGTREMV